MEARGATDRGGGAPAWVGFGGRPAYRGGRAANALGQAPGRAAERRGELSRRERRTEVVPLREIAAQRGEPFVRLGGLDALCDRLEPEAVREDDRGSHDGLAVRGLLQVEGEKAVDLELIDRHPVQVGVRRVAGPEAVNRDR